MRPIVAMPLGAFALSALVFAGVWFAMPGTPTPLYVEGRVSDLSGRGVSEARIDARATSLPPGVSAPHVTTDNAGRNGISISDALSESQLVVTVTTVDERVAARRLTRPSFGVTRLHLDLQLTAR